MPPQKSLSSESKEHKLFWAVGISAAVFAFFYTIVLPMHQRHELNLIADQKDQLKQASDEKREYLEQLKQAAIDNANLRKKIQKFNPGLFINGGAYPSGWEGVKIGAPINVLTIFYPEKSYEMEPGDEGSYISVTPKLKTDDFITSATYYYDRNAVFQKVERILFHTVFERKVEAIQPEELMEIFGRADVKKKETKKR